MDLDKAFIAALLASGNKGYTQAIRAGVNAGLLDPFGKDLFEFISEYHNRYGDIPSREVMLARGQIDLPDVPKEPVEFFADELVNRHLHGLMTSYVETVTQLLLRNKPREAYDQGLSRLYEIGSEVQAISAVESVPAHSPKVLEYYHKIKAGERGILTPWDSLNEATFGFWPEDLILFAARLGVGKTWLALILAQYAWQLGKVVLLATTEISQLVVALRWAAIHARIPYGDLSHGRLCVHHEDKLTDELQAVEHAPGFYIIGGDFDYRTQSLEAAIRQVRPDLVIGDGAYLMRAPGAKAAGRTEGAAYTFDELKRVAKRCSVPMVVTTQFNREVKTGSKASGIAAEKLALTDAAGWNADQIYGLYQTEEMRRDKILGFVPLKVREGVAEEWHVRWDLNRMDFTELPRDGVEGSKVGDANEDFGTGVKRSAVLDSIEGPPVLGGAGESAEGAESPYKPEDYF